MSIIESSDTRRHPRGDMNNNQHRTATDQAHPLVGREIIAEAHGAVVDVSIELLPRPTERNPDTPTLEPPDKAIIGVRVDRRDATSPPIHLWPQLTLMRRRGWRMS
jgi:hypothetical protein